MCYLLYAGGAANPDSQPDSPSNTQNLTAETNADINSGVHYGKQYILHPPLPLVSAITSTAGGAATAAIPLLLNPDIMQGTSVPILSPQVGCSPLLFFLIFVFILPCLYLYSQKGKIEPALAANDWPHVSMYLF